MNTDCSKPEGDTIEEIALARCDCLIAQYLRWKRDNHRKSNQAQYAALIFTAMTPVLLLLPGDYVRILAATTSALAAIATGFAAMAGWREQYIRYGYVWHALQTEKFLYLTGATQEYRNSDPEAVARKFASRIEQLVQQEVSEWRALMQRLEESPISRGKPGDLEVLGGSRAAA